MPKNRQEKLYDYDIKYGDIPKDYEERLAYLYDKLSIDPKKQTEILAKRDAMVSTLQYADFLIILYEEPEGAKRPRFRLINRKNIVNAAMFNPEFIHVYSPEAHSDNAYMRRLLTNEDFIPLNTMIHTPCNVDISSYHKIPSGVSKVDTFLSEIGIIRYPYFPDWDNIGKKYSDMFNENIWLDDSLVIDGAVHKYYSILPRIEIRIRYLNMAYNKQLFDRITSRGEYREEMNLQYFNMEDYNNGQYDKSAT